MSIVLLPQSRNKEKSLIIENKIKKIKIVIGKKKAREKEEKAKTEGRERRKEEENKETGRRL